MTPPRFRTFLAATTIALVFATPAFAQDGLTRAKNFYASADYDEALQVLVTLTNPANTEEAREVASYRVFCLVALGRTVEARMGVETIVKIDPLYHPSEAQASPRIRAFFEERVYATVIPRNIRLGEAPSHGLPAILYDVKSRGAEAYVALAREFLAREAALHDQPEPHHG